MPRDPADTRRKPPPRKKRGSTTTSTNVLRARALEMIAGGASVEAAARDVGRSPRVVREWQEAIAPAVEAKLAAVTDAIADGAVEARARLRRLAPDAADLVARIVRGVVDDDPQVTRVRLQAATVALDRGGVPAKTETEHSGTVKTKAVSEMQPHEAAAELERRLAALTPDQREKWRALEAALDNPEVKT